MKNSASLLVQNRDGAYLLIQRSDTCNNFKGWWEFPGGKIDPGESVSLAVRREALEETGIEVPALDDAVGCGITSQNGAVQYTFFAWRSEAPLEAKLSDEHRDFKWVKFTEARRIPNILETHREFLERHWLEQQIKAYEHELPRYREYAATLRALLEKLAKRWAPLAFVQARAKDLSSFAAKCMRKADKYDDPVHQLTDLCGGRIVTTTTDEAKTICRQIRRLFHPLDEEDDTSQRHATSAFGYLSVHFLVHFPADKSELLGVAIPPEIKGLIAEIQVRTLLQHAHSEVTHDRLYKAGYVPPKHCEREAARVAAGLESADDEFARFVHQLDAYVGHYAAHLPPNKRRRRLADLHLVLEHEREMHKKPAIALQMARLFRAAWDWLGIVETLQPYASSASLQQPWIQMELGNALCRVHRERPEGTEYQRGLALLAAVARPEDGLNDETEADERDCRATALAWLGSARSRVAGERQLARAALARAVELSPDDPYHFVAFVELDLAASGTADHVALLAPGLRRAADRCLEHARAGIEVTRAWLTLSKVRLLLEDETGAIEALCLAARVAETHHPLVDFGKSLDRLQDAIGHHRPSVGRLDNTALLLAKSIESGAGQKGTTPDWRPFLRKGNLPPVSRVLILAGSTAAGCEAELAQWEQPLLDALEGFHGVVLTGGTDAGVCALTARVVQRLQQAGKDDIRLVGYVPAGITASPAFTEIVRSAGKGEFSILEPLQMWADLHLSGVQVTPAKVTLLCLGGGDISAQELALAWAMGARAAVLTRPCLACERFAALLECAGDTSVGGAIIPNDAATLAMLFRTRSPGEDKTWERQWEAPGQAVHEDYVRNQHKRATQPNLLPWELLREDFKHSNRQQAATSVDILARAGFKVEPTSLPADQIPLPAFTDDEVERMAELEHGRWNVERLSEGWRYARDKDADRKLSPYLVSWNELPEEIKGYDRTAVRAWPKILVQAQLEIRRATVCACFSAAQLAKKPQ
ncbi:MAG: NUDIX domain-containing protein [Verrucomicrobia bacterium]|nr:NUDIX domain-containing protein [Verrucomicrobiota bacterium]